MPVSANGTQIARGLAPCAPCAANATMPPPGAIVDSTFCLFSYFGLSGIAGGAAENAPPLNGACSYERAPPFNYGARA